MNIYFVHFEINYEYTYAINESKEKDEKITKLEIDATEKDEKIKKLEIDAEMLKIIHKNTRIEINIISFCLKDMILILKKKYYKIYRYIFYLEKKLFMIILNKVKEKFFMKMNINVLNLKMEKILHVFLTKKEVDFYINIM